VFVRKLIALAGIALLAAAACSKTSTETVASAPPSASAAASPEASAMAAPVMLSGKVNNHGSKTLTGMTSTVELEQDSFYFDPTFVKADSGAHVTVTLKNESNVEHNFSITSLNIDKDVEAGKTETVTVTLPAGTAPVEFFCKYHKASGMQGAFYFK
jgi:plastocyanin